MHRRRVLTLCGFSLAWVTGCLSRGSQDGTESGDTDTNGVKSDTVTPSPTTTETPSPTATETPSSSPTPTPSSALVGGTVSAEPGETVEVPFTLTNTGYTRLDLAYFPFLGLADDANVRGNWADDFEDRTTWIPPEPIKPDETVTVRLPVNVDDEARGLYALQGDVWELNATGTAHLRVPPVPRDQEIVLRAKGGLGGFTSTGPPGSENIDERICPGGTGRILLYLQNVSETPIETVVIDPSLPDGWTVDEVTHTERWQSKDTRWRFHDLSPGRYRWSRVDLKAPTDIDERTTFNIEITGDVTDGTEQTVSARFTVDPNKSSDLTEC